LGVSCLNPLAWAFGQVLLVVVLIMVNAAFADSEIALVSRREGRSDALVDRATEGGSMVRLCGLPAGRHNGGLDADQVVVSDV